MRWRQATPRRRHQAEKHRATSVKTIPKQQVVERPIARLPTAVEIKARFFPHRTRPLVALQRKRAARRKQKRRPGAARVQCRGSHRKDPPVKKVLLLLQKLKDRRQLEMNTKKPELRTAKARRTTEPERCRGLHWGLRAYEKIRTALVRGSATDESLRINMSRKIWRRCHRLLHRDEVKVSAEQRLPEQSGSAVKAPPRHRQRRLARTNPQQSPTRKQNSRPRCAPRSGNGCCRERSRQPPR
mmetsp:Transcript_14135/g.35038  ORF Transcript_14135/g.35038 Transcript_14135/m.35038 type:complete len:242 (+) Transcript_14135:461-1186(+)